MASERLSENLIAICVVPKRVDRWPKSTSGTVWAKAHDCVDALQDVVRDVDLTCLQVEENKEFSSDAIRRRRAEICDKAMTKLANFTAFNVAEKALIDEINRLERLSYPSPQESQMYGKLKQVLRDLQEGIEATKRLVRERCGLRDRVFV